MSATFGAVTVPKYGSRFRLPATHPKVLEGNPSYVNALFGRAPEAWWAYDEVSGNAVDQTGGGNDLVPITSAYRGDSLLGVGDRSGATVQNGGPWQVASAAGLDIGLNDFIVTGLAEFRDNPAGLCSFGGKESSGPNVGWDILTFTDGRFQFDVWVAGAQRSANSGKDHRGQGVFPFMCGRVATRVANASFVYTLQGSQATSGLSAAGDITNAAKMTLPGAVAVAVAGNLGIPFGAIHIAADLSTLFDNRAAVLAGLVS